MFRVVKSMISNRLACITTREDAKHILTLIINRRVRAPWIYMRQTWIFGGSFCQKTKYKFNLENHWSKIKALISIWDPVYQAHLEILLNILVIILKLPNQCNRIALRKFLGKWNGPLNITRKWRWHLHKPKTRKQP